jgi:peptidoglycan hydrolase CwlO-like protein
MKILILFFGMLCCHTGYTQNKDNNNTEQIEQLQQVKQTVSRRIDSLNMQLQEISVAIENAQKKIQQLRKDSKSAQKKTTDDAKDKSSKLALELAKTENQQASLQKQFDTRLVALDKAAGLQSDLEEKIKALNKEKNK